MITAEFSLDHSLLQSALEEVPEAKLEWIWGDRDEERLKALMWGEGIEDHDELEEAIAADPTCTLERATANDKRGIYEIVINPDIAAVDLYAVFVDTGTVLDRGYVDHDGWHCRFVFPDEAALDRFFDTCRENDVEFEINRIRRSGRDEGDSSALTPEQRAAVQAAYESGYFDVPRAGGLEEVANRLDISTTASGHRLRRGLRRLVEQELGIA
ncbi:MAG: helix-turn-helix domain-containing protein [Salinirussus sp.]